MIYNNFLLKFSLGVDVKWLPNFQTKDSQVRFNLDLGLIIKKKTIDKEHSGNVYM